MLFFPFLFSTELKNSRAWRETANSQKTVSLAVLVLEKRVPLLKASQVSSTPSSSRETLWVMLDMVVIPPLSPCRQRAHMTVEAGDRQPRRLPMSFSPRGGKKKRGKSGGGTAERKQATLVGLGEYRWQISHCNN